MYDGMTREVRRSLSERQGRSRDVSRQSLITIARWHVALSSHHQGQQQHV